MLGCGTYEVYVFPRGGGSTPVAVEVPWNTLRWTRILDETSEAVISGAAGDCCQLLEVLRPWRHEFALYRNGELVWQGPLYQPKVTVDQATPKVNIEFPCRDLSAWWGRRLLHTDHDYGAGADLATIFTDYHNDAMSVDTTPNFVVAATPCGVVSERTTKAGEYRKAGDELRSIAQIGIDWTVVGRTALVGGVVVPTASIGTLTDDHFVAPPEPNLDGSAQANRWVVLGSGTNADGTNSVVGDSSDATVQGLDGVLEDVATDTSILDSPSALAAARTRVALSSSLIVVDQAVLSPTAPVTIHQLVPGALCRLELANTCPPVSETVRIKEVTVEAAETRPETVTVIFQPQGTTT